MGVVQIWGGDFDGWHVYLPSEDPVVIVDYQDGRPLKHPMVLSRTEVPGLYRCRGDLTTRRRQGKVAS